MARIAPWELRALEVAVERRLITARQRNAILAFEGDRDALVNAPDSLALPFARALHGRDKARFMLAIMRGEIDGDVIEV